MAEVQLIPRKTEDLPMRMHETVASGDLDGREFTVHRSAMGSLAHWVVMGDTYVEIPIEELIKAAVEIASKAEEKLDGL